MKKIKDIIKRIPILCKVIYCLLPVAILIHFLFTVSESFAEIYLRTVGAFFRTVLAWITNLFPFSVAEALIIFVPIILVAIIVCIFRKSCTDTTIIRILSGSFAALIMVYNLFVFDFAAGFYVRDIGEMYGLERRDITTDELYDATVITAEMTNEAYGEITTRGPFSTSLGMSFDEMNSKILDSFGNISDEYGYPVKLWSKAKPVALSEPMTYTHISGVYSFFTGEANVNVNYPDFVIPYTVAHELSHQRGVSREDEANFVAFLVCADSDDPYIRYSGYLNMFRYMSSALYSVDPEGYNEVCGMLDDGVMYELYTYSEFFDKYRDSVASNISDAVNDAYLSVMDDTDSRSYGMVVDLATLYLLNGDNVTSK